DGEWVVDAILGADRSSNQVFFSGFMDTPLEKHLYQQAITHYQYDTCPECANLRLVDGPPPTRITALGKSWLITMAPDGKSFIGTSSSPDQPPQTGLYLIDGVNALTIELEPGLISEALPIQEIAAQIISSFYGLSAQPVKGTENSIRINAFSAEVMEVFKAGLEEVTLYSEETGRIQLSEVSNVHFEPVRSEAKLIAWIEENKLDESHPYAPYLEDHTVPEYGTLTAEDGQTLYYSIQLPPNFDPSKKYPALVEVYGGPHVQVVTRNWERLSDQFYSREGYIVFRLDNRGSANRGKKFEDVIYRQMGIPEVRDQLVGVEWLKSQPFVDADRIGIQGWSYGGYMTLMTILQAPEGTFAAAVAGAPVTDWHLYDTFYTERYMDTPQDNPDGYEKSSVFYHLDRLETELPNLMLVHGMADDNVTFDNTTRLMAELQKKGIVFDLMTYPGQRHGIRGEALGIHLMKTRMAFLDRHLKASAE
ncbi:MAG: prolyl oligopeptidase family serine peptidase, partial [Pseudomonadota bacterium]